MSSAVPEGWGVYQLSSLLELHHGYQFRTPDFSETGIKVVKIGQVIGQGHLDLSDCDFVSEELAKEKKDFLLMSGDILMSLTGNIGRVGVVPVTDVPLIQNYRVGKFVPNLDKINQTFLPHILGSPMVTNQLETNSNSTAQANFGKADIDKIIVDIPPLPEQKKIASILTSVDEVIENTQKQIDKLQDLKKATMNELLTKGIGHTEFKDSELGRIPASWEVLLLDSVTQRGSGHTPSKQELSYWNGGIKWVSLADTFRLDNGLIYETDKEISDEGLANSSAVLHPAGTVVLSRDAGVGKSAVLNEEMAVSQHFIGWRCDERMDSWFLYYLLQLLKPVFENIAVGSTIKTIGLDFFKKLKITYPPRVEQKDISERLKSFDEHLRSLKSKLNKTKSLKKSLMQDLLTGKVRVMVN